MENERLQIQLIRELETEELQVEEVDHHSDDDSSDPGGDHGSVTFNTSLASLHTYLGEVEDTHGRLAFLEGGAILNLPMFYLEGVVLFPEATLPLTVIQPRFKASIETAMKRFDAANMIGVVRARRLPDDYRLHFATVGTTAEIRQYRQLEDSSLNVVTRGLQRFHLRRRWTDVDGVPWAEVEIIEEDVPLRTPKDAFGQLASVSNFQTRSYSRSMPSNSSCAKNHKYEEEENDWECMSDASIESDHSRMDKRVRHSVTDSYNGYGSVDESTSSDDEFVSELGHRLGGSRPDNSGSSRKSRMLDESNESNSIGLGTEESTRRRQSLKGDGWKKVWAADESKWLLRAPRSFWPHWVYRMYDPYCLARRLVDMWRQIIGVPSMDGLIHKPDTLSFYIASRIPVSESTRQELLEIDGVSYRLRREIQLLECFDLIRCKTCQTVIAKRSDMLVMSSDGPLNAYANPHGYVYEVMTLYNTNGLALIGSPVKEHSWFPGYAWTITNCATCEVNMGWLFTATNKTLQPRSFWGIRSSQVADSMC
ncbi:uncharacterized protein LOC131222940 [Magnolia sinica]|uniref:uncharacterized protein LOC131222940 n=1 Tax=Magnolia sinica TaxID=86752 RepID=UPI002658E96D|nr:uncharacterized protein LOC131222940 [Magnolia sinica]XP_058074181.1 uncharacterized protein LOC131222940 [Magnolia sinica]XP_058074182.1 uncharacterized protein LOC131222940 [Magnolia sinica]